MRSKNISLIDSDVPDAPQYKVYKKRWLILLLFCFYALSNRVQFIIYSVIANKLVRYYGVSFKLIQMTSFISVIEYVLFNFPATYFLDKMGIRWAVLLGLIGTCIGSWIKVASVDPSKYWILLLGQSITALFQTLIAPLPPKIAAVWFAKDEISKACSIGVIGIQISSVMGFLLSPLIVTGNSINEIGEGLYVIAYIIATIPTVLLPIVFFFFSDAPPTPPSIAQSDVRSNKKPFKESLKMIVTNRSFMVFFLIYGVCAGAVFPLVIILNEIVSIYHDNAEKHVGFIGALSIISSLFGAYVFGIILDKFKNLKKTTIIVFILGSFALILNISVLNTNVYILYFTGSLVGFFAVGLLLVALSLGLELTHPEPEGTVIGLLISNDKLFGLAFAFLLPYLLKTKSIMLTSIILACILLVTLSLFLLVKFDLRRQKAEEKKFEIKNIICNES